MSCLEDAIKTRQGCLEFIEQCNHQYNYNMNYVPPEIQQSSVYQRNPCVVLYKMAEAIPSGNEYDQYVVGLAQLAYKSIITSPLTICELWWIPVSTDGLVDIIGKKDTEWKNNVINIWMDSTLTQKHI